MSKRIVRKLPKDVVKLVNDFQQTAMAYGETLTIGAGAGDVVQDAKDKMLKARYALEKKLLDQGQIAAHGMRVLKAHRGRISPYKGAE